MPGQVVITRQQVETIYHETDHDVIVCEVVGSNQGMLDVWVLDEASSQSASHRSLILEADGNVLSDQEGVSDH